MSFFVFRLFYLGVAQGSVLGPLLHLVYTSNINFRKKSVNIFHKLICQSLKPENFTTSNKDVNEDVQKIQLLTNYYLKLSL